MDPRDPQRPVIQTELSQASEISAESGTVVSEESEWV